MKLKMIYWSFIHQVINRQKDLPLQKIDTELEIVNLN